MYILHGRWLLLCCSHVVVPAFTALSDVVNCTYVYLLHMECVCAFRRRTRTQLVVTSASGSGRACTPPMVDTELCSENEGGGDDDDNEALCDGQVAVDCKVTMKCTLARDVGGGGDRDGGGGVIRCLIVFVHMCRISSSFRQLYRLHFFFSWAGVTGSTAPRQRQGQEESSCREPLC
jgi:hypothetical protein